MRGSKSLREEDMPVKDIFDKPFDEGTLAKLEIFEKYFEEWLPTFVNFQIPIQVFDLFAGSGCDVNGIPGSPLRIIEIIKKHSAILQKHNKVVNLYFNDFDKRKILNLEKLINDKISEYGLASIIKPKFTNTTFVQCLKEYVMLLKNGCNLIFVDQNGFKEVNEKVFLFLINLETTDFMFFISSSHIRRFADEPEFKTHHPKFDAEKIKSASRKRVHNVICDEFYKYVPASIKSYGLIPFSLMKDDKNNIYGLIFVCKHPRAADKFLHIVWKQNALNGNANYDIDEDALKAQTHLFDAPKPTKIEFFQSLLREKILKGEIKNNVDAYFFSLNQGHISSHANEEINKMKKEKLITFESKSALVNYDKVIKERRILEYKLVGV